MKRYGQTNLAVVKALLYFPMVIQMLEGSFLEGLKYEVRAQYVHDNGRYIVLDALADHNPVILVNYYAPNIETDLIKVLDEITHIFDKIETSENTTFIWGGDFNLVFDINLDTDGGLPRLKVKSVSKLLSIMSEDSIIFWYLICFKTT